MKESSNKYSHLENELHYIFSQVTEILKFAEAKIAGIIAFNIALIIGVCQLNHFDSENCFLKFTMYYIVICSILSIFFSLIGIYAQLLPREKKIESDDDEKENLLYFQTIAKLTPNEFLSKIKERYLFKSVNEKFEFDMARQVVIVSQIAVRKFECFNIAMVFIFASIPPLAFFFLIFEIWFNPNRKGKSSKN